MREELKEIYLRDFSTISFLQINFENASPVIEGERAKFKIEGHIFKFLDGKSRYLLLQSITSSLTSSVSLVH